MSRSQSPGQARGQCSKMRIQLRTSRVFQQTSLQQKQTIHPPIKSNLPELSNATGIATTPPPAMSAMMNRLAVIQPKPEPIRRCVNESGWYCNNGKDSETTIIAMAPPSISGLTEFDRRCCHSAFHCTAGVNLQVY